jgi:hypothetical protein
MQLERDLQDLLPPFPSTFVAGQHPSPTDMSLGDSGRVRRKLGFDTIAGLEQSGDTGDARRLQGQQSTPRPDRRDHIVSGRGTQDPHGSGSRLLDALQQCISTAFGDPISVLDHNDLPPSQSRAHRRPANQLTHLVDADR